MKPTPYDYVIVGAGSAGCVLANRLSADPNVRVLLLEAGPRDWHPFIHMPAGLAKLIGKKGINWDYYTEPEPALEGRRLWWPRGKVLGGSSSINAMCYIRGHSRDYDEWASMGASGWSWRDVLPYFRRSEHQERGADALHGTGGHLNVADLRHHNPLSQVFLDAAREAGHRDNADFNGPAQAGVGWYQVTQKNGARWSTAAGYLAAARERAKPPASAMFEVPMPSRNIRKRSAIATSLVRSYVTRCVQRTTVHASRWSCRLRPTSARSARTSIPCARSIAAGPMPESISSCGELIAPPASSTSRAACATSTRPRRSYSTPVARVPSSTTRRARAPVTTVTLARSRAAAR